MLCAVGSWLWFLTAIFCFCSFASRTLNHCKNHRVKNELFYLSCVHKNISLAISHDSCRGWSQISEVYDIWLYPLQNLWRTVNEMSDFMHIGQIGNFIFRPVHDMGALTWLNVETLETVPSLADHLGALPIGTTTVFLIFTQHAGYVLGYVDPTSSNTTFGKVWFGSRNAAHTSTVWSPSSNVYALWLNPIIATT